MIWSRTNLAEISNNQSLIFLTPSTTLQKPWDNQIMLLLNLVITVKWTRKLYVLLSLYCNQLNEKIDLMRSMILTSLISFILG